MPGRPTPVVSQRESVAVLNVRFPRTLIAAAAAITLIGVTICLFVGYNVFHSLTSNGRLVERLYVLRGDILLHDETLTMSARLAAQSGDTRWIERYRLVEPALEEAIDQVLALADDEAVDRAANGTGEANAALVSMENRAFELVEVGRSTAALRLLDGEAYAEHKRAYGAGMREMLERVESLNAEAVARQRTYVAVSVAIGVVTLAVLLAGWIFVLHRVGRWTADLAAESTRRLAAEGRIRRLNDELEAKVLERTRALADSEARLSRQANIDELTGLATRRAGVQRLEQLLRRSGLERGARVVVASIDLRAFGNVNESFGHSVGDELLERAAERILRLAGAGGQAARLGGDEFLVARPFESEPGTAAEAAETLVEEIRQAFGDPFRVGDGPYELRVRPCIGTAVAPEHGTEARRLLRSADLAVHVAKSQGENGTFAFSTEIESERAARRQIERDLRKALERREFRLHYQPKLDLRSGRPAGVEALIRWAHAELGEVSPATFIPIAEETGLILDIGEWVLEEAVRQAATWRRERGLEVGVAVNVSPLQLHHGGFLETIRGTLARHALGARSLQIELTESSLLEDDEQTRELVNGIASLGCELALDDFGTGYSALSYLKRFAFDYLKIDRGFVGGMLENERDAAVTQAIIAMIDWGLDPQAAAALPHMVNRFGTYDLEEGTSAAALAEGLGAAGFETNMRALTSGLHLIAIGDTFAAQNDLQIAAERYLADGSADGYRAVLERMSRL